MHAKDAWQSPYQLCDLPNHPSVACALESEYELELQTFNYVNNSSN